ncbi:COQ9-domain-containing protein [Scheffersomyces amazonensis]|uniref:COQ9-domain-containing protein n=1 Tax=Scheffersomyces amazonensis TaxID=1078765 RepID=UPI00315CF90C
MIRTGIRASRSVVSRPLTFVRSYQSKDHTISNGESLESKILTKSLEFVPTYGFNSTCITKAIRELNYPDSLSSIINTDGSSPEFKLVSYWLSHSRKILEDHAKDPQSKEFHSLTNQYERVGYLIKKRLELNEPIIKHLTYGISQLIVPYNITKSMEELHNLSDDIAFYAGDESNDFAWYSKRMGISTIYVTSELYQLTDTSSNFKNTKKFVDEKVSHFQGLGSAYNDVEQWSAFNAISLINLIKSQLVRG